MKFLDISKPLITGILLEAENKNTHLEHLEDHIFNKGFEGAKEAVAYLYSLHEMLEGNSNSPVSMTQNGTEHQQSYVVKILKQVNFL